MSDGPSFMDAIPASVKASLAAVEFEACDNCGSPTEPKKLSMGLCVDCRLTAAKATPAPKPEAFTFDALPVATPRPPDELAERRRRREEIRRQRDPSPTNWIGIALEALRDLVLARSDGTFTADDVADAITAKGGQEPPDESAYRFLFDEAAKRAWIAPTDRAMPSRHHPGRRIRVYRSMV